MAIEPLILSVRHYPAVSRSSARNRHGHGQLGSAVRTEQSIYYPIHYVQLYNTTSLQRWISYSLKPAAHRSFLFIAVFIRYTPCIHSILGGATSLRLFHHHPWMGLVCSEAFLLVYVLRNLSIHRFSLSIIVDFRVIKAHCTNAPKNQDYTPTGMVAETKTWHRDYIAPT